MARYLINVGRRAAQPVAFSQVVDRALAGDSHAVNALLETTHYLGIGVSNLIVGSSPKAVVITGDFTRAWSIVEDKLNETIQRSIRRGLPSARIVASSLSDEPPLLGAISLVLARAFALSNAA